MMLKIRNAFWYAHRCFESQAKVHYGTAYALPGELGLFDVAVMGLMLLHNRYPLTIVQSCARLTTDTVVIVDQYDAELHRLGLPLLKLVPSAERFQVVDTWWHLSPALLKQFLQILGFSEFHLYMHRQKYMNEEMELFTLVARRASAAF